jgi:holo-[acyl-carrier protein] synthase
MINGIGVDMVQVSRMVHWQNSKGLLTRYFHPEELSNALSKGAGTTRSLAARFAAKEALGKALGTGLAFELKDVKVVNAPSGKPEIELFGTALDALNKSGANRVHISLTHEGEYAVAMIVLEQL